MIREMFMHDTAKLSNRKKSFRKELIHASNFEKKDWKSIKKSTYFVFPLDLFTKCDTSINVRNMFLGYKKKLYPIIYLIN